MEWLFSIFAAFIKDPVLILAPTGMFAAMTAYLFVASKREQPSRTYAWVLFVITCMWGAYAVWEAMMFRWTESLPPGPVIRVDLLVIHLGLVIATLIGVGAFIGGVSRLFTLPAPEPLRSWQDPSQPHE
jgi:hypothetical protein